MRTSLMISNYSWAGPAHDELAQVARLADAAGVDTLFVADHLLQSEPGTDATDPMLEAMTTLGHLAALTSHVRLGTMVASATLRPPALLVKAVTTLDVLSGGRAWFGIGAGYQQAEADRMGVHLPSTAVRFEWLEDTLELARRIWSGDERAYAGRRIHAGAPLGSPRPSTSPHPPILVGGVGEEKTLRLVARHADACNLPDVPDGGDLIRHKLAVLAEHCANEGRSVDEIEHTVSTRLEPGGDIDAFVGHCGDLAALGVDHVVVLTRGPWTSDTLAPLAAAVPAIAHLPNRRSAALRSGVSPSRGPRPRGVTAMNDLTIFLDAWADAERDCDAATTDRLLTDDFVGVGPVGFVLPKAEWLRRQTSGDLHYDALGLDEVATRDFGDCAVTTARWNARGHAHGHPLPEATRATLIAVRQGGGWRLAGIHCSFIAGTAGAPGAPAQP